MLFATEIWGIIVGLILYIPAIVKLMIKPLETDIRWIKRIMNGDNPVSRDDKE